MTRGQIIFSNALKTLRPNYNANLLNTPSLLFRPKAYKIRFGIFKKKCDTSYNLTRQSVMHLKILNASR